MQYNAFSLFSALLTHCHFFWYCLSYHHHHRHLLPSLSWTWIVPSTSPVIILIIAGNHRRLSSSSAATVILVVYHHHRETSSVIIAETIVLAPSRIIVVYHHYLLRTLIQSFSVANSSTHLPSSSRTSDSPTLAYHHRLFQPLRKTPPPLQQHEVDMSICTTSFIMFSVYACCCGRLARRCCTLRDRIWSSSLDLSM